jgi:hypothetical protein
MFVRTFLFCISFIPLTSWLSAGDWPHWRGLDRNGTSKETGWTDEWRGEPRIAWRANVGLGFSSIVIAKGRASTAGHADGRDTVICLDALTGKEQWKQSYPAELGDKAKDMEGALAELSAGNAKSRYDDYMMEQVAERHALFRAAGLPETEAQMQAMFGAQMPFLQVLNKIRGELVPKITERIAAGDTRGAIDLGATGVTMAAQMQTGSASHVILNELVAIAIERAILESLGSAPAVQLLGKSSADRLAALGERRDEIRDLTQTIDPGSHDLSADDLTRYFQLLVSDGEMQALQWLKAQKH